LNPQVLIVSGPIGSGKSKIAEQIAYRAKVTGYQVYGIISKRVMENGETIGYDGLDPQTGKTSQLVYHGDVIDGCYWNPLRGSFWYNERAFKDANKRLIKASILMDKKTLIIVDEHGHLEARGFGLFLGARK
jgi:nucleoside-triphosphatase THEP1